jgi:exodeoxyribonuclease V alpha subunit
VNEDRDSDITFNDIKKLHKQGSLRDLDFYLAEMLSRRFAGTAPEVLLAAALASHSLADNHICLDLDSTAGRKWPQVADDEKDLYQVSLPQKDCWIKLLSDSEICSSESESGKTALVIFGPRVYLRRYFDYEKCVADDLCGFANTETESDMKLSLSGADHDQLLQILFPEHKEFSNENEIRAAEVILKNRLLILSGGPGTGKTFTLARLTAMLVTAFKNKFDYAPVIKMAAPTGKAAMRMCESIRDAKKSIKTALEGGDNSGIIDILSGCIDDIPEDASTIHRMLGTIINSNKFRCNAENPLVADIVIIDEASMIDLSMMAKILDSLQENTKLILLGDMHQLASVNPGYVLGDICKAAQDAPESSLGKSLVKLDYSHRFKPGSPVDRLSSALHAAGDSGDPDGSKAWDTLQQLNNREVDGDCIHWHETPQKLQDAHGIPSHDFREIILENYKPLLKAATVEDAFAAVSKFRVFSPMRNGPYGFFAVNKLIENTLSLKNINKKKLDFSPLNISGEFYNHRIIMVRRNDYGLKLFNGDIGIVMPEDADGSGAGSVDECGKAKPVVWFESTDEKTGKNSYRAYPCNMLPEHETAFAMTIHKSQGSQYENVMVVMPSQDNENLFTKELLYTGITRAEKKVYLWCNENVFKASAIRQTKCTSGLRERLK